MIVLGSFKVAGKVVAICVKLSWRLLPVSSWTARLQQPTAPLHHQRQDQLCPPLGWAVKERLECAWTDRPALLYAAYATLTPGITTIDIPGLHRAPARVQSVVTAQPYAAIVGAQAVRVQPCLSHRPASAVRPVTVDATDSRSHTNTPLPDPPAHWNHRRVPISPRHPGHDHFNLSHLHNRPLPYRDTHASLTPNQPTHTRIPTEDRPPTAVQITPVAQYPDFESSHLPHVDGTEHRVPTTTPGQAAASPEPSPAAAPQRRAPIAAETPRKPRA